MTRTHDLRHLWSPHAATYDRGVTSRSINLVAIAASAVLWALVAVPILIGEPATWSVLGWWVAWVVGGVLFGLVQTPWADLRRLRLMVWPLVVASAVLFLLSPDTGFGPLPLTVAATVMAWILPIRTVFRTIAVLVALMLAVPLATTRSLTDLLSVLLYGGWMVFAALLVEGQQRVAAANARLQEANEELARTQARLAESSRTEERLRISRDLHDLMGHQLTALAVNLEVAAHLAHGPAREPVERSRTIAKELLGDVRSVVGQLRGPQLSLEDSLRSMADAVPMPRIHLEIDGELPIQSDRAEVLLRCVQEVITNAVRHSAADNLWVRITRDGDATVLDARDDGNGAEAPQPGHGLVGMRERLEHIGGAMAYESRPGGGFRVEARLPAAA